MGIFSRVADIISSNINAMLDKAEDPEKLIRLMIREMEDTLIEIKASCAGAMAQSKKIAREIEDVQANESRWADRARLAVEKGRDDLAREALLEKRRYTQRVEGLEHEQAHSQALVEQYQADIIQLEDKLAVVREKERMLVQRHVHAQNKKRAEQTIRKADYTGAVARFENLESKIDRMEADAELVNFGRKPDLEKEIDSLATDEDLEAELDALKSSGMLKKKNKDDDAE
ncbi:MAG: phage shock protein PspA [Candidatus Hydrogenedentes bacterium]|nr:phage shock protein PspA [Candidatus Hydrogenedentota bacterium]